MSSLQGINQRVVDRLLLEGRIGHDDRSRAIEYANRHKGRVEDALIDLEILAEGDLLKYVATANNTRFVSTEKLSKAAIDVRVLSKVSPKTASLHGVFPVLFDENNKVLSVVTADPDNDAALHELKIATGVREVRPLVARPAAVRAAIARHYHKDANAFTALLRPINSMADFFTHDPFERTSRPSPVPAPPVVTTQTASVTQTQPQSPPLPVTPAPAQTQIPSLQTAPAATPVPPPVTRLTPPTLPAVRESTPPAQPVAPAPAPPPPPPVVETREFMETLNVLVSLLENNRQDLRGHSSTVARLARKTCERIGLSPSHVSAFVTAAYLHDIGKMGAYHLTALNVAEYDGHRTAAVKAAELPAQLMSSVGLAAETIAAMSAMYERYDGRGFPNGQAGKEIPLGARILSVVDTYADLTQNARNPYRKILRPIEACEVLAEYRGKVFDPNIVDLFKQAMTGDDMRARLLADRHQALIIDVDPEETTVLELRLIEQGFEVRIARNSTQAWRDLETGEISVVVSEIDLEEPEAGLHLRAEAMKEQWGRDLTWIILTARTDRQTAQRAFELGVDDFVSKPASADIFAAKVRQLIERRAGQAGAAAGGRGVSGSLAEIGLPDMVQILWHGRKTCNLRVQVRNSSGEIHFADGQIVNARWEQQWGEEAFYRMLALTEGDFRLDPNFEPSSRSITASPEGLLLEGMRRLDEGTIHAP